MIYRILKDTRLLHKHVTVKLIVDIPCFRISSYNDTVADTKSKLDAVFPNNLCEVASELREAWLIPIVAGYFCIPVVGTV